MFLCTQHNNTIITQPVIMAKFYSNFQLQIPLIIIIQFTLLSMLIFRINCYKWMWTVRHHRLHRPQLLTTMTCQLEFHQCHQIVRQLQISSKSMSSQLKIILIRTVFRSRMWNAVRSYRRDNANWLIIRMNGFVIISGYVRALNIARRQKCICARGTFNMWIRCW